MHIVFTPLVYDLANNEWRYSSSEFLGGKFGMRYLHTQFYEQVGKDFGLERGKVGSRDTHKTAKDFAKFRPVFNKSIKSKIDGLENFEQIKAVLDQFKKEILILKSENNEYQQILNKIQSCVRSKDWLTLEKWFAPEEPKKPSQTHKKPFQNRTMTAGIEYLKPLGRK